MPTYEYRCDACGHELEEFQSMTAKPLKKCPDCGKNKLVRQIGTGAGIIFKGSGFYETDYRSEGYKESAKAETDAATPKKEEKPEKKSGEAKKTKKDTGKKAKPADKPSKPSN
ncbi:MAG: zinc ribbon domain-containing protein [Phycisphaerales bacterium]